MYKMASGINPLVERCRLQGQALSETETYFIIHVIDQTGLEAVQFHPELFEHGIKIQILAGIKKLFRKGVFLEIGAQCPKGLQTG